MATYLSLVTVERDSDFQDKVQSAITIGAIAVMDEVITVPNHDNRLIWAKEALENPKMKILGMLRAIVAINNALSISAILAASDSSIQANVNNSIDLFAQGA